MRVFHPLSHVWMTFNPAAAAKKARPEITTKANGGPRRRLGSMNRVRCSISQPTSRPPMVDVHEIWRAPPVGSIPESHLCSTDGGVDLHPWGEAGWTSGSMPRTGR